MIDYFYEQDADVFTFFRIPKELITNPKYKDTCDSAKLLYGLLLDRNSLSRKHGWLDEQRRVYIQYSREEAMETLRCSHGTIVKLFKELSAVELIEEVRQGFGKPNIIYVGKFIPSHGQNAPSGNGKTQAKGQEPCNAAIHQEVQNLDVEKYKNYTPRSANFERREVQNLDTSKTYTSKTDYNKTNLNNTDLKKDLYVKENNYTHKDLPGDHLDPESAKRGNITPQQRTYQPNTTTPVCEHTLSVKQVVKQLQEEIKNIVGETIVIPRLEKLVHDSPVERIRYHLEHWHIHRQNQMRPGAGYFLTVVENDIPPVAPPAKKPMYASTGKVAHRDNFEQREYSDEELESFYCKLDGEEDVPAAEQASSEPIGDRTDSLFQQADTDLDETQVYAALQAEDKTQDPLQAQEEQTSAHLDTASNADSNSTGETMDNCHEDEWCVPPTTELAEAGADEDYLWPEELETSPISLLGELSGEEQDGLECTSVVKNALRKLCQQVARQANVCEESTPAEGSTAEAQEADVESIATFGPEEETLVAREPLVTQEQTEQSFAGASHPSQREQLLTQEVSKPLVHLTEEDDAPGQAARIEPSDRCEAAEPLPHACLVACDHGEQLSQETTLCESTPNPFLDTGQHVVDSKPLSKEIAAQLQALYDRNKTRASPLSLARCGAVVEMPQARDRPHTPWYERLQAEQPLVMPHLVPLYEIDQDQEEEASSVTLKRVGV